MNATNPVIGRITAAGVITHYSAAGLRSPSGIASGSDGALWFVNSSSAADPTAGSIGRITTSGTVTNYTYPHSFQPYGIAAGPADTIWFTNGAAAGIRWSMEKMTTSGVVTDYANPDLGALGGAHRGGGGGITQGPDGAMWFTDGNAPAAIIGRMTATGTLPATAPLALTSPRTRSRPVLRTRCGSRWARTALGGCPPSCSAQAPR